MKVLLLNPPAPDLILRDSYCSHTSKAGYYWAPLDLLLQSGSLAQDHEVEILDAVIEGLSADQTLARIQAGAYGAIVALSSVLTAAADLELLSAAKKSLGCLNILMGDLFYSKPGIMIEHPAVDAVSLQLPCAGLNAYLRGETDLRDLIYKKDGKIVEGPLSQGSVSYPIPLHEGFPLALYSNPLARNARYTSIHTSFGCPYSCSYCALAEPPFRFRPMSEVMAELEHLRARGIREVWVRDYTFNSQLRRAKDFCRELIQRRLDMKWFCHMRPDGFDEELLDLMAAAGCHTVMIGAENANTGVLAQNQRRTSTDKTRLLFSLACEKGLMTLGHFILGLPGETRKSAWETIRFALTLDCDYLSLNVFAPRCGSAYAPAYGDYQEALLPQAELDSAEVTRSYCDLSVPALKWMKRYTMIRFYTRPRTLVRMIRSLESPSHLLERIRNLFHLLRPSGISRAER